jgi:hypothetical protein
VLWVCHATADGAGPQRISLLRVLAWFMCEAAVSAVVGWASKSNRWARIVQHAVHPQVV